MMSNNTWKKLDADLQTKIKKAAAIAQDYERELFVNQEKALFDELKNDFGVKVSAPADIKLWREGIKSVYEKNAESVGGMDLILKIADY